jgi:hypothetical protein
MEEIETRVLVFKIKRRMSRLEPKIETEMEESIDTDELIIIQVFKNSGLLVTGVQFARKRVFE